MLAAGLVPAHHAVDGLAILILDGGVVGRGGGGGLARTGRGPRHSQPRLPRVSPQGRRSHQRHSGQGAGLGQLPCGAAAAALLPTREELVLLSLRRAGCRAALLTCPALLTCAALCSAPHHPSLPAATQHCSPLRHAPHSCTPHLHTILITLLFQTTGDGVVRMLTRPGGSHCAVLPGS